MDKQMKRCIQKAYEAPQPDWQEKEDFLRTLPFTRISMGQFILTQAAYLGKRTLGLSVLLLFPALTGAYYVEKNILWMVSALVPFLGSIAVAENARSAAYGMNELEMSARFSLRSVVLARMGVLGALDLMILACLIPLCCAGGEFSLPQTGIYLLVPYLLTVTIGLWITRCFHGREAVYGCMGAAVLVSGAGMGLHLTADFVYRSSCMAWWFLLFIFLIGRLVREAYRTMKQTEELAWSL